MPARMLTYRLGLNNFAVHIVVLGRFRHLECNLNEAAREVLDRNKLSQGRLQDGFKLALSRAYIWIESISK